MNFQFNFSSFIIIYQQLMFLSISPANFALCAAILPFGGVRGGRAL